MALIWEDQIWLSNGAKIPIADLIIDAQTGRVLHAIYGVDPAYALNPLPTAPDRYRWVSGNTTDITPILTFDEKNAIYAVAKSYDLGSPAASPGPGVTGWAAITAAVVLVMVLMKRR
jgi:hypothetical protein